MPVVFINSTIFVIQTEEQVKYALEQKLEDDAQQQKERMLSMQELNHALNPQLTIQAHKLELQAQELVQKLRKVTT